MANARKKGHGFEREVANLLKPLFPNAKRHLEYQKEDCKGFDLDNTGKIKIQCKRGRKYAPLSKIKEPVCEQGEIPALVTKGDRERPVIAFYLDDWIELMQEAQSGR